FSWLPHLQIRYLEAFTPAVAAALGVGAVTLARRLRRPAWAAGACALLLAVPAAAAVRVVRSGASDSGHIGQMSAREADALAAFLARHTAGRRYELASATAVKAAPVIERAARPVLMLDTLAGRPLTPLRALLGAVRRGLLTYVRLGGR